MKPVGPDNINFLFEVLHETIDQVGEHIEELEAKLERLERENAELRATVERLKVGEEVKNGRT